MGRARGQYGVADAVRAGSIARAALLALGSVCAVLALASAPALAVRGHELKGQFGDPCTGAGGVCEAGQLQEPVAVAVDESTKPLAQPQAGDVYVVDRAGGAVDVYSAAGHYEFQFNGSGTLANENHKAAPAPLEDPSAVAVDNSCYLQELKGTAGLCADESIGDVYVLDAGHRVIDKFSATGEYLGQIAGTEVCEKIGEAPPCSGSRLEPAPFEELDGLAVGVNGVVWVYQEIPESNPRHQAGIGAEIDEFTDGSANVFGSGMSSRANGFPGPGFAVDAEGDFYAIHMGSDLVAKLDRTGAVLDEEVGELEGVRGLAAELSSGDIYLATAPSGTPTSVARVSSAGALLETLSATNLTGAVGVGVNATSETVYATDAGEGVVDVFAASPPSTPTVEAESVTNVTAESATLGAEINPRGASTEYRFEYGPCPSAGCEGAGYSDALPMPSATLGASFEVQTVSVHPQNLSAGTLYHYRVRAHNGLSGEGETYGEEPKTFTTQPVNVGFSLPDGRAWELVSPPDKHGALIETIGEGQLTQAAADGSGITYVAAAPSEDEPKHEPQGFTNKVQVLSTRGANGWESRDIAPPHERATGLSQSLGQEYRFFSEDLTSAVVQPFGAFTAEGPGALAPGEASEQTAFLRDVHPEGDTGSTCMASCYRPLVTGAAGFSNVREGAVFGEVGEGGRVCPPETICGPRFKGATPDLSHVVLESNVALTDTPLPETGLYEWSAGKLALVSVLPDETAAAGRPQLGHLNRDARNAISADGSRIVWGEHEGEQHLYLRDMTLEKTVQLDEVQGGSGENSSEPSFQFASTEGSRIFFTDGQRLTEDSGGGPDPSHQEDDLYECEIEVVAGASVCHLTDLTPRNAKEEGADVLNEVLGASVDGSSVYFVANGELTEEEANANGEQAVHGDCVGLSSKVGAQCSLYVDRDEGGKWRIRFIANLAGADFPDWNGNASANYLANMPVRVSPNGQWLAFMSQRGLACTSRTVPTERCPSFNDTRDAATGQPDEQVYLYDAATGQIACPSCDPTGARPVGVEYKNLRYGLDGLEVWPESQRLAASVPAWTAYTATGEALYQSRYLDDSGRMFFNSNDALVPQDNNHTGDVYEFEPEGVPAESEHRCTTASATFSERSGGCVDLISSGESSEESGFLDASKNGEDVFFLTASKLVPEDEDTSLDVYDAHECTEKSPCFVPRGVQPPGCDTADACKPAPTPQPSIFGAPASATLTSTGNPPPAVVAKPKAKSLTRAQKLAKALKACAKQPKRKRAKCRAKAKRAYGPIRKAKKAHRGVR